MDPFQGLININKKNNSENKIYADTVSSKNSILENKFSIIQNKNVKFNLSQKIDNCKNQESLGEVSIEFKKVETKKSDDNVNNKKNEIVINKHNLTFLKYVLYLINPKYKNQKITFYKNFRIHIISEENLIQNYFDIYRLIKVCKVEILNPFELKTWSKDNF